MAAVSFFLPQASCKHFTAAALSRNLTSVPVADYIISATPFHANSNYRLFYTFVKGEGKKEMMDIQERNFFIEGVCCDIIHKAKGKKKLLEGLRCSLA